MKKRILALILALSLLLPSCSGGRKDTAAASMHLRRTEGTVSVSDGSGKDIPPLDNLGLYSGYGVGTQTASYAWIDLDDVKLAKLDQKSEISIEKEGKILNIELKSGSLFFNVTKPLKDDETMNIRTSTMLIGIRGTCGWVVNNGERGAQVFLLEGAVEAEATDTGEIVQVTAGNMAEVTVNENGETAITVQPFIEEDTAPFVLTELENDPALNAAILEASGLDILNPPSPAERLMAGYQKIIASRPILDNGAAEGVSYTFNGTTFTAGNGLTDAVCIDLDGDGIEELLLVIREQGDWYFGQPISRLEVYGSESGRTVLLDSVDSSDSALFFDANDMNDYGNYHSRWPNGFCIVVSDGKPCIYLSCAYQAVENEYLFALENGALTLIERMAGWILSTPYTVIGDEDGVYTKLEIPALPEDAQRKNAYLSLLDDDYAWTIYAELADLDQDGAEELLVLRDSFFSRGAEFFSYSWDESGYRRTDYETGVVYAKLIDMDQDGKEELLLVDEDTHAVMAYSWDATGMHKYEICELWWDHYIQYNGTICRDTVTGDIYIGTISNGYSTKSSRYTSLTDSVVANWDSDYSGFDYGYAPWEHEPSTPEEAAEMEAARAESEREEQQYYATIERFELIERIELPQSERDISPSFGQLSNTIDTVRQRLMAR